MYLSFCRDRKPSSDTLYLGTDTGSKASINAETEVELGEETMPLKIGESKLVLKRITNSIVCYTFKWCRVYLVQYV